MNNLFDLFSVTAVRIALSIRVIWHKFSVDRFKKIASGSCRDFWIGKESNIMSESIFVDSGAPHSVLGIKVNAYKARFIVSLLRFVTAVIAVRCLPKIGNAVVRANAVDVVNRRRRILSEEMQPRNPMPAVGHASTHLNIDIARRLDNARNLSCVSRVPFARVFWALSPTKNSSFGIVIQYAADKVCSQVRSVFCGHINFQSANFGRPIMVTTTPNTL